jgi:hypothetical protein
MRVAAALGSLAIASLASAPALADCIPGTGVCASAGVGIPGVNANGQITIGIPPFFGPPPAPPPAAPAPPVVVPQYAPPPPPQVYVYPQYGYPQAPPPPQYAAPRPDWGASKLGLDFHVDGAAGVASGLHPSYGLGGAGLALRGRLTPHFGVELGVDVLGGRDYNGNKRLEVAGNLGGLLYFNPRSRVQVYLSGGLLADHAKATPAPEARTTNLFIAREDLVYNHVGGYAGLGLEFFATQHLAFHLDARGVVREKVSGTPGPEFTDPTTGRTTNTSGGVVGQGGVVFYF